MSETRPTPLETLSKTLARLRHRGPAEVATTIRSQLSAALASDGSIRLMIRTATGGAREQPPLEFRRADASDGEAYARDIATDSAWSFGRRLTSHTWCYLVLEGPRILHASWTTTRSAWTSELHAYICPPAGDAYVYESFTRPDARGRGIYPFALHHLSADLAERGVRQIWVGVEPENLASVRAITKAGFEEALDLPFERRFFRVRLLEARGPQAARAGELVAKAPPR